VTYYRFDRRCLSFFFAFVSGDSVTIASTEELLDACEQYVGQKVLRITTYVKPRTTASGASPSSHSAAAKAAASSDNRKPPPPSADRGTSTRSETTTTPPIQIHDVLESFVGVLSTAVSHLQEGLAAPSPKNPRGSLPTSAKPEANGEESAKAPKKPEREAGIPADEDETKPAAEVVGEEETPKSETKDNHDENESDDDEDTEDKDEPRSFIHGRHTCDSCLATPIIGKRYHSTNVSFIFLFRFIDACVFLLLFVTLIYILICVTCLFHAYSFRTTISARTAFTTTKGKRLLLKLRN
jgi:hypothetical protein